MTRNAVRSSCVSGRCFAGMFALLSVVARAQLAAVPVPVEGSPAAELAARAVRGGGVALLVTAHPDDEDNASAALLRHRHGVRVVLWTMTRGEGGQNEIGSEQGEALKLLRDAELQAAHRFDGIEQFRLRDADGRSIDVPDFGFSFSVSETMAKWSPERPGRGSLRAVLQAVRPDVVLTMSPGGDGGGQHHQTSAQLMLEECALERNPWREDGRYADAAPWHVPSKVYSADSSNWVPPGASRPAVRPEDPVAASRPVESIDIDVFDPLLGRTYRELAAEARSMHKSQGMSRLLDPWGPTSRRYRLMIDRTAGGAAATRPTERGVPLFGGISAPARAEFLDADGARRDAAGSLARLDVRLRAWTDRDRVAAGDSVQVVVDVGTGLGREVVAEQIELRRRVGLADSALCAASRPTHDPGRSGVGLRRIALTAVVPENAAAEAARDPAEPDPAPFFVRATVTVDGERRTVETPLLARSPGDVLSGEQRDPVVVVPAWDARIEPELLVPPTRAGIEGAAVPLRVRIRRNAFAAGRGVVGVEVVGVPPEAARVELATAEFGALNGGEEAVVHGVLRIAPGRSPGPFDWTLRATLTAVESRPTAGRATTSLPIVVSELDPAPVADLAWRRVIDYPHVERRLLREPAVARVRAFDLSLPPAGVRVGYVRGIGEDSDVLLRQLGADLRVLDAEELAAGDLDRYDVLVIGARAYEFRPDLAAHHRRLVARAERGGVVICQYQKSGLPFSRYAPFPAKIGSGRVTDEAGPVRLLAGEHPVFLTPNRIGAGDFTSWVRDRSLYHLEPDALSRDRFTELLVVEDTFGSNAGPHPGALVEARVGKGRWIYCALALWRQLPEGVPGAWRLWANLISLRSDP